MCKHYSVHGLCSVAVADVGTACMCLNTLSLLMLLLVNAFMLTVSGTLLAGAKVQHQGS
jgi:hypothetical protein